MPPMLDITPAHRDMLGRCRDAMAGHRPFLIGVDGWQSAGKSTISRFLAWQLHVPCIETDFFLKTWGQYDWDRLQYMLKQRLDNRRCVIVEGVGLLNTLKMLKVDADFLIYMRSDERDAQDSDAFLNWINAYDEAYRPEARADIVFNRVTPRYDTEPPLSAALEGSSKPVASV